jgi:hypothetical protein
MRRNMLLVNRQESSCGYKKSCKKSILDKFFIMKDSFHPHLMQNSKYSAQARVILCKQWRVVL